MCVVRKCGAGDLVGVRVDVDGDEAGGGPKDGVVLSLEVGNGVDAEDDGDWCAR